ncbi:MAG TPA: bifunctional pyr operon transcriptional regulator/uracil phosphoribosyltransferase PyrR [Chromatiaceae bacterium]|jgi:pyrimidine operon attenuation protein/uracil phosphoribosyltransferase|nr:bifunctional pyr operon transcriptional regulator/uracil phosphoribosyltransferase PyrR [Chromatiaceae bacterium]HIN83230.1 bifunctional pyr operon transcriptional regulator/uracil phosphoribosyltransferase PyrR [Chromatiales bacterium]HIA08168.1 bifunctional pyr operon transcriptional regulator/uracil phosphoribosyltransferase PyrR [Chromatiaceae bacterium]HIB83133.1 bifunctional pyr operon transcriptional regulator/uracil phosphoribosyltransferase PyrR [Chromatiaceae bacterium]HIO14474.1 b
MPEHINVDNLIASMADELRDLLVTRSIDNPVMIGIHTGGVWVASRLHALLNIDDPLGTLDISFYRDDFTKIGMNPQVKPSNLPASIDGRHIILVDDVLYTGRTIRAALNEIFDFGRPASVLLAALIDRDGRELPMAADVSGHAITLAPNCHIKLTGPEPLSLSESILEDT